MSSQTASSVPWLVWSEATSEVIVSGELAGQHELNTLTQYAQGRQVIVVINSADVRLYRHTMSTKPNKQIIKALPFMLEDEVAEDIDQLHFAVHDSGQDKPSGDYWLNLAIVRKSLIEQWLQMLSDAGINVKKMLPEVLCLPYNPEDDRKTISIVGINNGWLIRDGQWQGSFVENDWLPLLVSQWQMAANDSEEEDSKASELTLEYFSELPEAVVTQLDDTQHITCKAADPELPMLLLAKGANANNWNLLQGDLAPKKPVSKNWLLWRSAAALFVITLIVEFVAMSANWYQAEQQLVIAKQELEEQYKQAFPREKVRMALLRRQLTRKVAEATGGAAGAETGFLLIMDKIAPVLKEFPNVKSDSYRFDGKRNELRLSAIAPSFQQFELFRAALEKLGLEIKQGAVNNEGNTVSGSLNIREAS